MRSYLPFIGHATIQPQSRSSSGSIGSRNSAMTFAHAVILKDWADREGLPMEEPDETMLSRSRSRAMDALYNAEVARTLDQSSASSRSFGDLHVAEPSTISANVITTDVSLIDTETRASSGLSTALSQRQFPARIWAFVVATLVLGLAYAPNFADLYSDLERRSQLLARITDNPDRFVHPLAADCRTYRRSHPRPRFRHHGGAGSS